MIAAREMRGQNPAYTPASNVFNIFYKKKATRLGSLFKIVACYWAPTQLNQSLGISSLSTICNSFEMQSLFMLVLRS